MHYTIKLNICQGFVRDFYIVTVFINLLYFYKNKGVQSVLQAILLYQYALHIFSDPVPL